MCARVFQLEVCWMHPDISVINAVRFEITSYLVLYNLPPSIVIME